MGMIRPSQALCARASRLVAAGAAAFLAAGSGAGPALSQTPEQFFSGRNLNFIVGVSPGGGYDQ
jgi:tripartite-type tricarboxylate transporter receptor subunit TctC